MRGENAKTGGKNAFLCLKMGQKCALGKWDKSKISGGTPASMGKICLLPYKTLILLLAVTKHFVAYNNKDCLLKTNS